MVRFVVQIVVHGDASECVEVELISQFQIMEKKKMVGGEGFEPPTRCL